MKQSKTQHSETTPVWRILSIKEYWVTWSTLHPALIRPLVQVNQGQLYWKADGGWCKVILVILQSGSNEISFKGLTRQKGVAAKDGLT